MQYEERTQISTPEGVDVELVLAGVGSRAAAGALDLVLRGAAFAAFAAVVGLLVRPSQGLAIALLAIGGFLVIWLYDVVFELTSSGQTPGKKTLGIRVTRAKGRPVDLRASVVRNLLRVVDGPMTAWALGVATIVFTKGNQRLGDLAADTYVVREKFAAEKYRTPVEVDEGAAQRTRGWDVTGLTPHERTAVQRFLERRDHLAPAARGHLADDLAGSLRPKVAGSAADPSVGSEQFLVLLGARLASR
ncbi:MAG: RDD family protein [Solirubrobacterales bacterium]